MQSVGKNNFVADIYDTNSAFSPEVRGQGKNTEKKLAMLATKQRELIREAMHNADLSTQDRLTLIKQMKAAFSRESDQSALLFSIHAFNGYHGLAKL